MYKYITDLYDAGSDWEELKELPGSTDYPRAEATKKIFKEYLLNRKGSTEVLEIGPGSGYITEQLSDALPEDGTCSLDLMDFSDGFLLNTKSKNFKIREYICFDVSKHQTVPTSQKRYNIIFFQEVLEHLVSPFTALVNISNLLHEGGCVFLTIPNSGYWRNIFNENLRLKYFLVPKLFMDTHINELSTIGLVKLATMVGFDVIRIEHYCSKYPLFRSLTSEQVGFLLIKRCQPEERWVELTGQLRIQNKRLLSHKK